MFCTHCGAAIATDTRFCGSCGAPARSSLDQSPSPSIAASPLESSFVNVSQIRPWIRFWARTFDICLATFATAVIIEIVYPEWFNEKNGFQFLFETIVLFVWVFVEPFFLSAIGNTPGKWLFKTHIVLINGNKLNYQTALSRSFNVWWRGLGFGFPIVYLFTLARAHHNLTKSLVTTWDRGGGFKVVHERIGAMRIIVAIGLFLGFVMLIVIGNAPNS